ncbi:MAG: hypothetical protein Q4G68_12620 [Planctomycetia bacterium]|nr:hypothetical protein [Planctomycetia bacterium]
MLRKTGYIVALIVMAAWMGCRSCGAPYDSCQPTFVPEHGDQCMGELYRAGSVMGGMKRTEPSETGCKSCQASAAAATVPQYEQVQQEMTTQDGSAFIPGDKTASLTPQATTVSSEVELMPYGNSAEEMMTPGTEPLLKDGEFILSE